ncbi:predicted protein [Entamoeba histolytica]
MEELINKNNKLIKELVETLPNIQQSIDDVNKKYQYYLGSIKNEVFKIKDDETYEQAIKRGEGIFDRIDETERRRKLVIEKSQETINQIEIIKKQMSRIIEECKYDEGTLSKTWDELIVNIISIEEVKMRDKILRKPQEKDKITSEFNKKKEEWKTYYSDYFSRKKIKEEERKKQEQERKIQEHDRKIRELEKKIQEHEKKIREVEEEERRKEEERKKQEEKLRMKGMSTMEEIRQIEEWTNREITNILFDSDIDNWNINTSVFGERIWNKKHIIIIIEDSEGNKFGGYVNSKIDKVNGGYWINDSQSFVFSLESKGRMEGMKKFDIKEPQHAFWLDNQTDDCLFEFGYGYRGDICVYKENDKTKSYCSEYSFEYEGISNALCGKQYPYRFTPKRIIVIEMK